MLIMGDCTEKIKTMKDNSIYLTLTDIPYNEVNRKSNGLRNLDKGIADSSIFDMDKLLNEIIRVTEGSIYMFCGINQVSQLRMFFQDAKLSTRLCIWKKTNPSPMNGNTIWLSGIECCIFAKKEGVVFNEHCKNSVWEFPTAKGKLHPNMKPVKLMEYLINVSSNRGGVVFDPFMGSGTTGVACLHTNREFIGIEKDPQYFSIAKKRIEDEQSSIFTLS